MKKLIAAAVFAVPLFVLSTTHADAAEKTPTPQQSKMAACAKENKGLKGAEYKKARKACLSRDGSASAAKPAKAAAKSAPDNKNEDAPAADKPSQKNKMAACSQENKGKKGDEYKTAQKECLAR